MEMVSPVAECWIKVYMGVPGGRETQCRAEAHWEPIAIVNVADMAWALPGVTAGDWNSHRESY